MDSKRFRQLVGLVLLLLGALYFVVGGMRAERHVLHSIDFKGLYGGSRCMLHGCNPYNEAQIHDAYSAAGGDPAAWYSSDYNANYLPGALLLVVPLAELPWGPAHTIWLWCIAFGVVLAGFLVWDMSREYAPVLSGGLIGLLLATGTMLLFEANPSGLVLSFCVVAVWCFLGNRYTWLGATCLALSLLLKPHVTGFVWLYFMLANARYRKLALQTLAITVVVMAAAVTWVTLAPASHHWIHDLQVNLNGIKMPGYPSYPGPTNPDAIYIVDLQTVLSVFRNDPRVYDPLAKVIILLFLLPWAYISLRAPDSREKDLLGISTVLVVSMLPIYHRSYDARLLILAIPVIALLVHRSTTTMTTKVVGIVLVTGTILMTSQITVSRIIRSHHPDWSTLGHTLQSLVLFRPMPLILLLLGIFLFMQYSAVCRVKRV